MRTHPEGVDLVPLSAVPGEECDAASAGAAAPPSKAYCVSPLLSCIFAMKSQSVHVVHDCMFAPCCDRQHVDTLPSMRVEGTTADNL